jgi:hypothetical protein
MSTKKNSESRGKEGIPTTMYRAATLILNESSGVCYIAKPVLAATAACVFGYVALVTKDTPTRAIASAIVANAILCHVFGCVKWDVACNAAFAVGVLATSTTPCRLVCIALPAALAWGANDVWIDSCAVHAFCVQGMGAYLLLNWRRAG